MKRRIVHGPRRGGAFARPGCGTGRQGFTLVETIIVLAIVGLLIGGLVPLVAAFEEGTRVRETRQQLEALKRGIVGADSPPEGESERSFGFVGDMGALPDSLPQLARRLGLPAFRVDSTAGLGVGWRGPYLDTRFSDDSLALELDAFGRPIRYDTTTKTVDGVEWAGELRSAGPDGVFDNGDDIVVPLPADRVRTEVHVFLVNHVRRALASGPIGLTFRRNGTLVDTTVLTDTVGHAVVPGLSVGPILVRAASTPGGQRIAFEHGSELVSGNNSDNVEFDIVNVSPGPVELTSLTVFLPELLDDRCYRAATLAGVSLFPAGTNIRCSGETLTFADTVRLESAVHAVNSVDRRRFSGSGAVSLAPEVRAAGGPFFRGVARVTLERWRDLFGEGDPVNMQGVTMTVTFSDGMTITFTTPG